MEKQLKQREKPVRCWIFKITPDESGDEVLITNFLSDKEFVSALAINDEKIVIFYKDKGS